MIVINNSIKSGFDPTEKQKQELMDIAKKDYKTIILCVGQTYTNHYGRIQFWFFDEKNSSQIVEIKDGK